MEELEKNSVAELRMLINNEKVINKEDFYKFINLIKVFPVFLDLAKKNT